MSCIEATAKVYVILDHPPYVIRKYRLLFSSCGTDIFLTNDNGLRDVQSKLLYVSLIIMVDNYAPKIDFCAVVFGQKQ